ncbi:MAG: helix-turn-helix transcriptional regulator [Bacilli bacterium]|nr:helix-turn-helix transcriptional regulator [Bacilli bacterium]
MKETLGLRLSRLRKEKNLTQEDIANKINISSQAVSKWENDLSSPDIDTLVRLANIFDVSLDELLGNENKKTVTTINNNKSINDLILKIRVLSNDGDKVVVNLPLAIVNVCLENGMNIPQVSSKITSSNIDFKKILELVNQGVIGELVNIETADGDKVSIVVE